MNETKHIGIIGAGLVGSLLSIYLAKRGYRVSVFERRGDLRETNSDEGRSINLALSTRGIRALEQADLASEVKNISIPMHGRMMHDRAGNLSFLPYGKHGQYINSISRNALNHLLIEKAEEHDVTFHFRHRCTSVDLEKTSVTFQSGENQIRTASFDLVVGADGVYSAVRSAMQITDRFNYSQHYLEHGYKELVIPAARNSEFALEKNALHIWPRESFMMIALPNPDKTFTCTLFLPFTGESSFNTLAGNNKVMAFFSEMFPDAVKLMPGLAHDFQKNSPASLVTIKCFPWMRNNTFLIGDAAHGIVPFYGQGMNAAFEDCRILDELLNNHHDDWTVVLPEFQHTRKQDSDAIAQLAFDNFIEMRDLVADPAFLLRKKIEAKLHELYPEKWIPLYSMVTFNDNIRYSQAYHAGKRQAEIMDKVMETPDLSTRWQELNFREIVDRLS